MIPGHDPRQPSEPSQTDFQVFLSLWVGGFVFHFDHPAPFGFVEGALFATCAWCLYAPSGLSFLAFFAPSTLTLLWQLPAASNHSLLALLVHCCIALEFVTAAIRRKPISMARLLSSARPAILTTLAVVYFFAIFHKLNVDFLLSPGSCAGALLRSAARLNGIGLAELSHQVLVFSAFATIVVEAAILVGLLLPRFRFAGICIGVGFHSALALASFYDFSTFVFAIYVLIFSSESTTSTNRHRHYRVAYALLVTLFAFTALTGSWGETSTGVRWHSIRVIIWLAGAVPLVLAVLLANKGDQRLRLGPRGWLAVAPILAITTGLSPYLGVKTVSSFSMFSNLQTEKGRPNHIIPSVASLEVTPWLRDTVLVHSFSVARYRPTLLAQLRGGDYRLRRQMRWSNELPNVELPWLELRRVVQMWHDAGGDGIRVSYTRNGRRFESLAAEDDPSLQRLSWWAYSFQAFRAIQGEGVGPCRW